MNENLIISIICLVLVPIIFQIRVYKYQKALRRTQLPAIKGTVISTKVEIERHEHEDQNGYRSTDYTYKPIITYRYEVNGRPYQNTRYSTMSEPLFNNQSDADIFLKRYEDGEEISVFYDPNKPSISFLSTEIKEKRINLSTWILMFSFLVLSIIFMFMGVK